MTHHRSPAWPAVTIAVFVVALDTGLWLVYQCALGSPRGWFYAMAGLCFVLIPLIGALTAVRVMQRRPAPPSRARAAGTGAAILGAVVGAQLVGFLVGYSFVPYVTAVTTVDTRVARCDGTYTTSDRRIQVGGRTGIVLHQDTDVIAAAVVDPDTHASSVHLIRPDDDKIVFSISYPDDTVAVAVSDTTVFIFNDALGTLIDKGTGARAPRAMSIDSYGRNESHPFESPSLFGHDGTFETTGYFSIWWQDGSVDLLQRLTFSGIQSGCFIDGDTNTLHPL